MTIMGVHVNGQGGGGGGLSTSLGDTLAKAIFGDPETEMKLALGRQQYESEAWKRRLWDAQIEAENAQAANAAAQAADREYQTRSRQDAAGVIANQQAGLLEPPAPVELSPATKRYDLPPDAPAIVADDPYSIYAAGQSVAPPLPGGMNLPVVAPPSQLLAGAEPPDSPYGRLQAGETAGLQPPRESFTPPSATDSQLPDIGMPVPVDVPAVTGVRPEDQAAHDRNVAAIKARVKAAMAMGQSAKDIAEGMGVSEGAVRLLSSDPQQQKLGTVLYTGSNPPDKTPAAPGTSPYLKEELDMRKQIEGLDAYKKLSAVVPVYLSMAKTAGGPIDNAAIMDLVYGLATAEDPGSVVREADSLQVKRIGGLSGEVQALVGYVTGDKPMTAETVGQIMRIAKNRISSYQQAYEHQAASYRDIATRSGFDVRNAVPTFPSLDAPAEAALPTGVTEDMVAEYLRRNPTVDRDKAIKILVDRLSRSGGQ